MMKDDMRYVINYAISQAVTSNIAILDDDTGEGTESLAYEESQLIRLRAIRLWVAENM